MSQRRRNEKLLQLQSNTRKKQLMLLCLAFLLTVIAITAVTRYCNRPEAKVRSAATEILAETSATTVKLNKQEVDGKKLVIVWRVFHGGAQSGPKLAQTPKDLVAFLRHHDQMLAHQIFQFEKYGAERYRVIAESFVGEDSIRQVAEIQPMIEMLVGDLDSLVSSAIAGDKNAQNKIAQLLESSPDTISLFSVQGRLASYFSKKRIYKVFYGADLPGGNPLGALTRQRLVPLMAQQQMPSDDQIRDFLKLMREDIHGDNKKRHRHIASTIQKFEEGTVINVLIGSSHSEYGNRIEKTFIGPSLEEEIARVNTLVPLTLEQRDHDLLLDFMRRNSSHIVTADTPLEEMREIIEKLRKEKK